MTNGVSPDAIPPFPPEKPRTRRGRGSASTGRRTKRPIGYIDDYNPFEFQKQLQGLGTALKSDA